VPARENSVHGLGGVGPRQPLDEVVQLLRVDLARQFKFKKQAATIGVGRDVEDCKNRAAP